MEKRIGKVTHFPTMISVAVLELTAEPEMGRPIHIPWGPSPTLTTVGSFRRSNTKKSSQLDQGQRWPLKVQRRNEKGIRCTRSLRGKAY